MGSAVMLLAPRTPLGDSIPGSNGGKVISSGRPGGH
jgi:hypothetical protein